MPRLADDVYITCPLPHEYTWHDEWRFLKTWCIMSLSAAGFLRLTRETASQLLTDLESVSQLTKLTSLLDAAEACCTSFTPRLLHLVHTSLTSSSLVLCTAMLTNVLIYTGCLKTWHTLFVCSVHTIKQNYATSKLSFYVKTFKRTYLQRILR